MKAFLYYCSIGVAVGIGIGFGLSTYGNLERWVHDKAGIFQTNKAGSIPEERRPL